MQQLQGASRFNRRAIKVEQAIQLVVESVKPGLQESIALWQAGGRRLAESLNATTDWPPFCAVRNGRLCRPQRGYDAGVTRLSGDAACA